MLSEREVLGEFKHMGLRGLCTWFNNTWSVGCQCYASHLDLICGAHLMRLDQPLYYTGKKKMGPWGLIPGLLFWQMAALATILLWLCFLTIGKCLFFHQLQIKHVHFIVLCMLILYLLHGL